MVAPPLTDYFLLMIMNGRVYYNQINICMHINIQKIQRNFSRASPPKQFENLLIDGSQKPLRKHNKILYKNLYSTKYMTIE